MPLSKFYSKAKLDILLVIFAIFFFWVMLSSSSDPIVTWLEGTAIANAFEQFETGNQIAFDLSVGILSAIGMFYLLVRLPEYERKSRIKRHLRLSYHAFKRSAIQIFVGAIRGSYDSETVDQLMNQREFREYFRKPHTHNQDKWHGVANNMDDFMLRQLVVEAEVLQSEFQHALSIVDIRDPEVYSFMKRLAEALYRAKNWSADYEGVKEVLGFFWSILAGWSFIDGYTEREFISDMIERL